MTHPRYGVVVWKITLASYRTDIRRSDGAAEPDGTLRVVTRKKILHYRHLYLDRPDPIVFMSVAVDTSDRSPLCWF